MKTFVCAKCGAEKQFDPRWTHDLSLQQGKKLFPGYQIDKDRLACVPCAMLLFEQINKVEITSAIVEWQPST